MINIIPRNAARILISSSLARLASRDRLAAKLFFLRRSWYAFSLTSACSMLPLLFPLVLSMLSSLDSMLMSFSDESLESEFSESNELDLEKVEPDLLSVEFNLEKVEGLEFVSASCFNISSLTFRANISIFQDFKNS